jgi:SAM-dependent methyltransferase
MEEWTQEKILALARGFMESRVVLTAAQLNLFSLLQNGPLGSTEVADRCQADQRAMTILLDALAAMGLLTKVGETYRCEESVGPWLVENAPHTILPMVLHAVNLWTRWSNLTTIVAGAQVAERSGDDWLRSFIGAMHVIGAPQADRIVAQINPAKARQLLDVGGASGTYTLAFLRAAPEMQATLFDRLEVVEMAREQLGAAGMLDRVRLVAGDFYVDPLPGGHDLALVSAIIHQNGPEQNEALFRKVLHALQPGGRIIIRDHVLGPDRTTPRSAAIFAVNMLTGTSGGNCYTFEEIREGLSRAGFQRISLLAADTRMDGLVEAFKP